MPVRLDMTNFRQIIRSAKAVRKVDDWRMDIQSDWIRLRTFSECKTLYLDHVLPSSLFSDFETDGASSSFWINIDPNEEDFKEPLRFGPSNAVVLMFPCERADRMMVIQSGNLTYRFSQIEPVYRLRDPPTSDTIATVSLQHELFDRAVQVADLVGEKMRIEVDPDVGHVKFSSQNSLGDQFGYTVSGDQISELSGDAVSVTSSIARLRNVTKRIPDSATVVLHLTHDHLKLQITGHIPDATLEIYIAQYRNRI